MSQSEPSLVTHFDGGGLDEAVAEADVEGVVGADVMTAFAADPNDAETDAT